MIIGIVAAMDKEIKLIKESLNNYQKAVTSYYGEMSTLPSLWLNLVLMAFR